MSNGNEHVKLRIPVCVLSGFVKGNRHIEIPDHTLTVGALHLDIAQKMGVELASFGPKEITTTVGLS